MEFPAQTQTIVAGGLVLVCLGWLVLRVAKPFRRSGAGRARSEAEGGEVAAQTADKLLQIDPLESGDS